jgi:hypothetical protein
LVFDDPLPAADRAAGTSAALEVLVVSHDGTSDQAGRDPLQAAMRDLSAPVAPGVSGETLEACRIALLDSANKLAAMRRLTEAYHREIDSTVCGTPAAGEPSRAGTV